MRIFEKCDGQVWGSSLTLFAALAGFTLAVSSEEGKPGGTAITPKSTSNPTGLQVGVNPAEAGVLPPGTEALAKEGAMASADMDWDKAKKSYEQMLKMAPENPLALSNLGAVEFRLGNLDAALDYLDRATRAAPMIAQNWLTIGLIHHGRGQSYLALSALSRALHADPGDPRAHNYMGVVIRGLGWATGAETELQRAIAIDPAYADAHFNLAVMYLDRTPPLFELARRHYYAALEYGAKPDPVIEQKLNPAAASVPADGGTGTMPNAVPASGAPAGMVPAPASVRPPDAAASAPKTTDPSSLRGKAPGANSIGKPRK